jgi:hypothetical protein
MPIERDEAGIGELRWGAQLAGAERSRRAADATKIGFDRIEAFGQRHGSCEARALDPPATPSFFAFSYTVLSEGRAARIIRRGDQSPAAMREKARFVLRAMEQRMTALGFGWADVSATQVYTIFDIHPLLADEIVRRGAAPGGLTWHFARPPVQGLDFEMDVRGVAREFVI